MKGLTRWAICSVVVLAGFQAQVQAQADLQPRFPWDQRPNRCFIEQGDAPGNPQCVTNHWPSYRETVSRVSNLFDDPRYELVHRAEQELGFSNARFPSGEYYFEAWYAALYEIFTRSSRREPNDRIADGWQRALGREGYVELAQALIVFGDAMEARGTGYASTVSPENWGLYYKKLEQADALLDSASSGIKSTASRHALKLHIALQHPKLKSQASSIFNKATDLWPTYTRLYTMPMIFSLPIWSGTFADVERIARVAVAKNTRDGAAVYAKVYEQTFRNLMQYKLPDSVVDWGLMKQGMRELASYELGAWDWGNFARLACQMGDRAEAKERFILADVQPDINRIAPRDYQHECREFANGSGKVERGEGR